MNKHLKLKGYLPSTYTCAMLPLLQTLRHFRGRAVAVLSEGPCAATQQARFGELASGRIQNGAMRPRGFQIVRLGAFGALRDTRGLKELRDFKGVSYGMFT